MYLLYCDESGDLADPNVSVFVVAGVAVHEDAVRPVAGEINNELKRYVGKDDAAALELHGSLMRAGSAEWKHVPGNRRFGLYHSLLKMIGEWQHEPTGTSIEPFAVVMDRDHSQSPTETTYGELLYAFDARLRQGRKAGDPHNGILLADRSRYEKTLQAWVEVARAFKGRPAQDPRRLYALAETPVFVDSRSTRLMQLADLVAHALYRGYQSDDWQLANTVMEAFPSGRIAHFTSGACDCPACRKERPSTRS